MKKHLVLITITFSFLFAIPSAKAIEEVIVTGYPGGVGVASLSWYVYYGTQFSVSALSKAFDEKPLTEEQKQQNRCNAAMKSIETERKQCEADAESTFESSFNTQCSGLKQTSGYSGQVGLNIATGGGGINVGGSINSTYNPQAVCIQTITNRRTTTYKQCELNELRAKNSLTCPAQ